jgi:3-hydroxyacyl-CoA dehydrogenase
MPKARTALFVGHFARPIALFSSAFGHDVPTTARDIDLAMRWGFGMKQGPFELWQEAGWLTVATMIKEDIDAGKALCNAPLPDWVFKGPVAEAGGVHTPAGSWSASNRSICSGAQPACIPTPVFPRKRARCGTSPAATSSRHHLA